MRTIFAPAALIAAATGVLSAQTTPSAVDLAQKIQAHYDTVRDFRADFTQTYQGGFTKKQPPQSGDVRIKKPGRLFWRYKTGDKTEVWADGTKLYTYMPASKQGIVEPLPQGNESSAAVLFLMDRGNLVRDFTPSLEANQPTGQWRLSLIPRRPDPDTTSFVLSVDRANLTMSSIETKDSQGGTNTVVFTNLKENVGLADREFVRNPLFPAGTEKIVR